MRRPGLDRTDDFQKFCRSRLDQIQFYWIRTGLGLKNFTVNSSLAHTHLIDATINDALQIVTGCLHPTPANNLPILAGIQLAELRRNGATLSLDALPWSLDISNHSALACPLCANAWRLKSRHPFEPASQQLISSSDNHGRN